MAKAKVLKFQIKSCQWNDKSLSNGA